MPKYATNLTIRQKNPPNHKQENLGKFASPRDWSESLAENIHTTQYTPICTGKCYTFKFKELSGKFDVSYTEIYYTEFVIPFTV